MKVNQFVKRISLDHVIDLGASTGKKEYNSIFSMVTDQSIVNEYIHEQFLGNAGNFRKKYTNYTRYLEIINQSFSAIDILKAKRYKRDVKKILGFFSNEDMPFRDRNLKILDIGSGFGNSIFPILDLCPNSTVVATDLSIQLLQLLKEEANNRGISNLGYFQMNAEELNFREESFDLIVGASILHHLFSPNKTVECCSKILKNGGYAVFYEPFEMGNMLIKVIFKDLIASSKNNQLSEDVIKFFNAIINDYDHRLGRDKSSDYYRYMDDKWLFTGTYFKELALENNFSNCHIYSIRQPHDIFEGQIIELLRLGLGKGPHCLPDWAWCKIQEYDKLFSEDAKSEIITDGCVIFHK